MNYFPALRSQSDGLYQCKHCGEWLWGRLERVNVDPTRWEMVWYHSLTEFRRCDIHKAQLGEPILDDKEKV